MVDKLHIKMLYYFVKKFKIKTLKSKIGHFQWIFSESEFKHSTLKDLKLLNACVNKNEKILVKKQQLYGTDILCIL